MRMRELVRGVPDEAAPDMRMIEPPPGNTETARQLLSKIDAINAHGTANVSNGDPYMSNDDVPRVNFTRRLQQAQGAEPIVDPLNGPTPPPAPPILPRPSFTGRRGLGLRNNRI